VRAYFVKKPSDTNAGFTQPDVNFESVQMLPARLEDICLEATFSELPIPSDIGEAL
jgi:hypothetical protein